MEREDSSLWSRVRADDVEAFGLLFDRYATAIYNYCFRRTGSWDTAEDLLSIVFLEAWRRHDQELPPDKVLPWLYGIATNVVRNRRRSERRFAALLRRLPTPRPDPGFDDLVAARIDDERQMRYVLALTRRLPKREQDVLALCAWGGTELRGSRGRARRSGGNCPLAPFARAATVAGTRFRSRT